MTPRDTVSRFSSRVENYVRYRPSYPREILAVLEKASGLTSASVVADVGAGPGNLAALFLDLACEVIAVEPNAEMRAACEAALGGRARFRVVDGRAEVTGLPSGSVDFVTAAQAFHWFDAEPARAEFRRILRPGGWLVLVWNERLTDTPFLAGYEALLSRYSEEYPRVDHRRVDAAAIEKFFGHSNWREERLANEQRFDLDGVIGRLQSSSYTPPAGSELHEGLVREVSALFARHQVDGFVSFTYSTRLYYGRL